MDPRFLKYFLAVPLATCPASLAQPSVHRAVSVAPARDWPGRPDLPEDQEPDHGEGSSESLINLGVGGYTNISNTATVTVHSGFSGYVSVAPAAWLPKNFPLVVSTKDFLVEPFSVASPRIRPDSKGHVANPEVRRVLGSRSGHRG